MTVIYNAQISKAMSGGDVDVSEFAASIFYYSAGTAIQLRNKFGEVISSMDASDFIVDGMVEDVEIIDGNLVISFNTDAGKSDISIPISDIFDASNYYTTEEVDLEIDEAIEALHLGDAAQKDVDSEITAQSDANVPTSSAVKSYIVAQGFTTMGAVQNYVEGQNFATVSQLPTVNNGTVTIKKNAEDTERPFSFSLNQSGNAEMNIGLGDAAEHDVDTTIGSSASSNLPTSDAVKSYVQGQGYATIGQLPTVNNASVTIKKNAADTSNPFSFTLNQSNNAELDLGLGAAAFKAVDSAISSASSSNPPSSDAVKDYVASLGYVTPGQLPTVGNGVVTIQKNSSDATPFSFSTNQSANATLDLDLGAAAFKQVDTGISDAVASNDIPTSDAVKSYVNGKGFATTGQIPTVSNATVTIKKNASDTASPFAFGLNQLSDATLDLGLGAAAFKAVDSSISGSSSNLPTSDAVQNYVSGQLPTVNNSTISIKRHSLDANPMSFTLNQSSGANLDIGLGDAAVKAVDSTITDGTTQSDLPTSDAVKSYIANKGFAASSDVKNSIITIERNSSQSNPPTFTLNQSSNQTIDLGLGAAAEKDVDTSIGSSASSNLPTTDAVKGYAYSKAEIDSSYIVSAVFDSTNNVLTLVRGDGTTITVQF